MFIHEAVTLAMREDGFIRRTGVDNANAYHATKIKPTNSYANCIVYTFDSNGKEIHHCKNWNVSADDLMADDWEPVEGENIPESSGGAGGIS